MQMDLMIPFEEPFRLIKAFFIIGGLYVDGKLFWMLVYEIKYYKGAGEDYWYYGKEYVKNKWFYISRGAMSLEDYTKNDFHEK